MTLNPSSLGVGAMVERIQIEHHDPPPLAVTSLARVTSTATMTTTVAHGYTNGDYVTIAGATPNGYNGKYKITVTSPTAFTYVCNSTLATPATGTITTTYVSDAQGGQKLGWLAYGPPLRAELFSLNRPVPEIVQGAAVQSETMYRFRVRRRLDLTTAMRVAWRPSWPRDGETLTLAIVALAPEQDGRTFMWIDCKGA